MSTSVLFFFVCLVFLIVIAILVVLPWLRSPATTDKPDTIKLGVAIFKSRLAELDADFSQKKLDIDDYSQQKADLERQLLAVHQESSSVLLRPSKLMIIIIMLWVPILAIISYFMLSSRAELFKYWQATDQYGVLVDDFLTQKIHQFPQSTENNGLQLIQAMQHNVYAHPIDTVRWAVLGQTFNNIGATEQSLAISKRLYALQPDNEQVALSYAQSLIDAQQDSVSIETKDILNSILSKNPQQEAALMMLSMAHFKANDFDAALKALEDLRATLSSHGGTAESLAMLDKTIILTKAKQSAQQEMKQHSVINQNLDLSVSISPVLQKQLKPTDSLFVLVKAKQGGGMPYAAQKLDVQMLLETGKIVADLPLAKEMMPGRSAVIALQQGVPLVVLARVSKTGQPMPMSGDFESMPVSLTADNKQYQLIIDQTKE